MFPEVVAATKHARSELGIPINGSYDIHEFCHNLHNPAPHGVELTYDSLLCWPESNGYQIRPCGDVSYAVPCRSIVGC
jgi:hypothetical protein